MLPKQLLRANASPILALLFFAGAACGAPPPSSSIRCSTACTSARLPMVFEPNRGQADRQVRFIGRGPATQVFITDRDAVVTVFEPVAQDFLRKRQSRTTPARAASVRIRVDGAKAASAVEAFEELPGRANFLIGSNRRKWITNVPTYRRVVGKHILPGVDVTYDGGTGSLEYTLSVAPGADTSGMSITFDGASTLQLDASGDLLIGTSLGKLRHKKPRAYQTIAGVQRDVPCWYASPGRNRAGIGLGTYNRAHPLIIDPVVVYGNTINASGSDLVRAVAADAAGNAYITGQTNSVDFPVTAGALKATLSVNESDAFVSKLNPAGTGYVYSTYLGGGANSSADGFAIAVDGSGNAYLAGRSTSGAFPLQNPIQSTGVMFICKLNATGTNLVYSTRLGSSQTVPTGIALDAAGGVRVCGQIDSAPGLPLVNSIQPSVAPGQFAGFVAALNPAGSAIQFSSVMGGSTVRVNTSDSVVGTFLLDAAEGVTVDAAGNTYVAGTTQSTTFPLRNPIQSTLRGFSDAFLTKLDTSGNLVWSTYLGGGALERATSLALGPDGSPHVVGLTRSTDFPLQSAYDGANSNGAATYITRVNPTGTGLTYSTYFHGGGSLVEPFVAVDSAGRIYFNSTGTITAVNPPANSGVAHGASHVGVFVVVLAPATNALVMTVPLPSQNITALGLDVPGNLYVTQISQPPPNFAFASLITKVSSLSASPVLSVVAQPAAARRDAEITITVTSSEALVSAPTVQFGQIALTPSSQSGLTYTFKYTLSGSEPQGATTVSVSAQSVGGATASDNSRSVVVDFDAPTLQNVVATPLYADVGTDLQVSFTASEPLAGTPVVMIGNLSSTLLSQSQNSYVFHRIIQATDAQGSKTIIVAVADPAGNVTQDSSRNVTLDFDAPQFSAPLANPTLATTGTVVRLSFGASEPLAGLPTVLVGNQSATFVSASGLDYTYAVTVTSAAGEGRPQVTVTGSDHAGRSGSSSAQPLLTDFTPPQFTGISVSPAVASLNTTVSISFQATEPIPNGPVVTVGGTPASRVSSAALSYVYSVPLNVSMGSGRPPILIRGFDRVGIPGQSSTTPFLADLEPPQPVIGGFPTPVDEGSTREFRSSGSSALSGISEYSWEFGDGRTSTLPDPSHVYADGPAARTVRLTVTNGAGVRATAQLMLPVLNVSPTITLEPMPSTVRGLRALRWTVSDPGSSDTHRVTLIAKDMVTGLNTEVFRDRPSLRDESFDWDTSRVDESSYQLFASVTDQDGGQGAASSNPFVVDNRPLAIDPEAPRPQVFNPTFGESTFFPYFLSEHATTRIELVRVAQQSAVATLQTETPQLAGQNGVMWDGRNPLDGAILADDQYGFVVNGTDLAGRTTVSDSSRVGFVVRLHTGPPTPPVLNPAPPARTRVATLVLSGRKDPNTKTTVIRSGQVLVSSDFDALEAWSADVQLNEGPNALAIVSENRAGQQSASSNVTVTLKTTVPAAVIVNPPQSPTQLSQQTLSGSKEAGTSVMMNGELIPVVLADTTWSTTVSYTVGTTRFTFVGQDDVGNTSAPASVDITLTGNPVAAPTIDPFTSPVNQRTVTISGTKPPDTSLELTAQGVSDTTFSETTTEPLSSATTWSLSIGLPEGASTLTARAFDGVRSASPSTTGNVFADTVKPNVQIVGITEAQIISEANIPVQINYNDPVPGTGLSGIQILLDGQDITGTASLGASASTLTLTNVSIASHRLVVRLLDAASNVAEVGVSFARWVDDGASVPRLTNLEPEDRVFTPDNVFTDDGPRVLTIKYALTEPSSLDVEVVDSSGSLVTNFTLPQTTPGHEVPITFDGKFPSGEFVAPGNYRVRMTPRNQAGRQGPAVSVECEVYY